MGDRPRRLELRRAVRRSQQRRLPRSLSRQRLRLGVARRELLVRLLQGRRRPPGRDRRRRELAGDGACAASPAISRSGSGSTMAPAAFVDVAQMVGATDRHDGRVGRAGRSPGRGVARRRRRQPARTAARSTRTTSPPAGTGSGSICRAAARAISGPMHPAAPAAAIAARSARRCRSSGAGGSRCRKCRAGRASARRTSAGCTSGSERRDDRQGRGALAVGKSAGTDRHRARTAFTGSKEPA